MMPMTPSGTLTREISRPLGRVHRANTAPTGSWRAATSSRPCAIASTRFSSSLSRSIIVAESERPPPSARSRRLASRIAARSPRIVDAAFRSASVFCSAGARASSDAACRAAAPIARISAESRSPPSPGEGGGWSVPAESFAFMAKPLAHHEIIAMDHLVASTVAEDRLDFTAFVAGNGTGVIARIGGETAAELAPVAPAHHHRVAPLEASLDCDHAGGQKAGATLQGRRRAVIDGQYAHGIERAGDPTLARRARLGRGEEPGRGRAGLDGRQRMAAASARDHHAAARGHGDARGDELRHHAAGAVAAGCLAAHRFDLARELAHFGEMPRRRVLPG